MTGTGGIELVGIGKRFGEVRALADVSLRLAPGEVHAVLGENGAGKSTLLAILSGMLRPDRGRILLDGAPLELASPAEALARDIGTVYQHFTLVPTLSVRDNLLLGSESRLGGRRLGGRRRGQGDALTQELARYGIELPLEPLAGTLPIGLRQRVEIAKALLRNPRFLLLDEPTSVLAPAEVEALLALIRRLAEQGIAVVFVTHKLEEALAASDRITVLRGGVLALSEPVHASGPGIRERLLEAMFGSAAPKVAVPVDEHPPGPVRLRVVDITTQEGHADRLAGLSLDLAAGEVLGIAGVAGNGQRALAEVIAGQRVPASGTIWLDGKNVTKNVVAEMLAAGVGMTTDERVGEGIVASLPVDLNLALKDLNKPAIARGPWLDRRAVRRRAEALIATYEIRPPDPARPAGMLSGGNIQKLLLARELARDPRVLVCLEPTAGLDLRTATRIRALLRERAVSGTAVLLISSDLDELLAVSDRIGVIVQGRIVATLPRSRFDRIVIGRLMLGGAVAAAPA